MARSVKHEVHASKRNDILDVAQRLIYTKGYEQMSIQDVLDALKISKGAFYHYFDSKPALLEALIARLQLEVEGIVIPIVRDASVPALPKLQRIFDTSVRWKTAHKAYLLAFLRVWYLDDNAIVRQKATATMFERVAPLLAEVLRQGIDEGTFDANDPEQVAVVALSIMVGLGESFARELLALSPGQAGQRRLESRERLERILTAYARALERVLGLSPGRLELMDARSLDEWVLVPEEEHRVSVNGYR
jgi:AcrR family transcriptional regulator